MRTLFSLVLAATIVSACEGPVPRTLTSQDSTALRGLFDLAQTAISSGDFVTWAGHYADSAVFMPPNGPAVVGRAAIQAWGQAMPPVERFAFSDVRIYGEGNLAYGTSSYVLKLRLDGVPADSGKQLIVWGRQADGTWQVLRGAFNSNIPLPPSPASPRGR